MPHWHDLLACPHCGAPLAERAGVLGCERGHRFDIARQGYVNLLPGGAHTGTADSPDMVAARSALLAHGHFSALDEELARAVGDAVAEVPGCIVDAGAGTGEHLAAVLEALPDRTGLALDISKHAARRAAQAHARIGAVVADVWEALPVRGGVAAAVMSVFAPRNAAEFARVLAPGGALVVAAPAVDHLGELVDALGMVSVDPRKTERLAAALGTHFRQTRSTAVTRQLLLSHDDARAAALMGPSAHHLNPAEAEELVQALPEPFPTTLSVIVSTWSSSSLRGDA